MRCACKWRYLIRFDLRRRAAQLESSQRAVGEAQRRRDEEARAREASVRRCALLEAATATATAAAAQVLLLCARGVRVRGICGRQRALRCAGEH